MDRQINPSHTLAVGDVVTRKIDGRRGVIRAVDGDAYVVFWWQIRVEGGGWRASDLLLDYTAAEASIRHAASIARRVEARRIATIARVRAAAGLPDWHADEVEAEIARVNACASVEAYRAASREGSKTPLGARAKIAIWRAVHVHA